ncbi:MAG: response regulator [Deltaproteobacteria bacterium]|nr:response regulator [Deltaproteobacteria bacterium]
MGEAKKEAKDDAAPNLGQAISGRILVAEDNKAIKNMVSRFLEFIGFEVVLGGNGLEALSPFLNASFDLVLTDLDMPFMDGWGLTSCIKEKSPDTPVVLMTGEDRETVFRNLERRPVDSVIFKPFALKDLQSTIQGALELRR